MIRSAQKFQREYQNWYNDEMDGSEKIKADAMETLIRDNGTIQSVKDLGNGLFERKWRKGLRIYFATVAIDGNATLLILGSNKNDQARTIPKAKEILKKHKVINEVKKIQ